MTQPPTPPGPNSRRAAALWRLATLAVGGLLAFLLGSATPRVRLIGIYPLALGACVAWCGVQLRERMSLEVTRAAAVWIVLLAAVVHAGSGVQSWRIWKQGLLREHAGQMAQMQRMLKDAAPEFRERAQRDIALARRHALEFRTYLSQRLGQFAQQIGRREVWGSPVPEAVFGFEMFLAGIGALVTVLASTRSGPWAPPPAERPGGENRA